MSQAIFSIVRLAITQVEIFPASSAKIYRKVKVTTCTTSRFYFYDAKRSVVKSFYGSDGDNVQVSATCWVRHSVVSPFRARSLKF